MIKITIVTVNLNNVKTIEKTIQSVLNQDYDNLEYIFIDGGSTDGSLEIINRYKEKFKYFKSSPDKNVYDAMNKGIEQASGDYIGFVNGGDLIYKNSLSQINKVFSKQKNKLFFSVADIDYIDTSDNVVGSNFCLSNKEIIKKRFIKMPANHLSIFVPLDTFKKYGLFDLRFKYRADFLFILRLIENGYLPINLKIKIGAFRLGGISGGYKTFLENFRVIKLINNNLFLGIYSSLVGLTKLFLQRNFENIYKFIVETYHKFSGQKIQKKIFKSSSVKVIHLIDFDIGGGAEKLVKSLYENLDYNYKIITLRKLSDKNNNNPNYYSLNVSSDGSISIIFGFLKFFKFLYKLKDKNNIILHSHLSKSLYIAFLASIFFDVLHIHTEHNTYNRRRKKKYLYFIEYLIYNSLKHTICISEATQYALLKYMPSIKLHNISIIENGTKLYQHKTRNIHKDKYNILILGSLTYKKGIDLFIEILPFIMDEINLVRIVGSGPEKQNLINLTKKLSLDKVIEFVPFVDDCSKYIYDADIGVIPSRWEGFGLVAVEMRSSGMPILVSDIPGLGSIFSAYNAVYTFKKESKESLKNSLKKLLDDFSKDKIKVRDINLDFEIYSEKSFIKRYDNKYKKIIANK